MMVIEAFLRLLKRLPRRNRNTDKKNPVLLNQGQSQNQVTVTDSARDPPSNNLKRDILGLLDQFSPNLKEPLVREIQSKWQIRMTSDEIKRKSKTFFVSENHPSQHLEKFISTSNIYKATSRKVLWKFLK